MINRKLRKHNFVFSFNIKGDLTLVFFMKLRAVQRKGVVWKRKKNKKKEREEGRNWHFPFPKIDSEQKRRRRNWISSNSRKQSKTYEKAKQVIDFGIMANLPQSLSMGTPFGGPSTSAQIPAGAPANKDRNLASAEQLVLDLSNPELRENALLELSKVILLISNMISSLSLPSGFSLFSSDSCWTRARVSFSLYRCWQVDKFANFYLWNDIWRGQVEF